MHRWLEEFELKHTEFKRSIRAFHTMHTVWDTMASKSTLPGHAAFARRQSTIYLDLHNDAKSWFAEAGVPRFVNAADSDFVQELLSFREEELGWLNKLTGVSIDHD
jgi:hypothetical protein